MSEKDLRQRLLDACVGHPNAKIPWPHYLLHEAEAEIGRLRAIISEVAEGEHYEYCHAGSECQSVEEHVARRLKDKVDTCA